MHPVASDFGIKSSSECSEPTSDSDVGGGFLHDCLPFAVGSTVTVAISTFNLISDWLAYRALVRLDVPAHARNVYNRTCAADTTSLDMPCSVHILPDLFFVFCVMASLAYCLSLVQHGAAFRQQRKNFIDRMDGVPLKRPLWDRHGDEVMLLLTLVVEDLPVSCVLFALQFAISCEFYVPLGGAVFVVSVAGTCASVAWKLARVAWKVRRGRRRAPRAIGGTLLLGTLVIVALNLTLITSGGRHVVPQRLLDTRLFDKIAIDHWVNSQNVAFAHTVNTRAEPRDFQSIVAVKNILHSPDTVVTRCRKCDHGLFGKHFHKQNLGGQCVVVFHFLYSTRHRAIFYNYGDRVCSSNRRDVCGPPRTDAPCKGSGESHEADDNDFIGNGEVTTFPATEKSPIVGRLTFYPLRHSRASNVCAFDLVQHRTRLPIPSCS